MERIEGPAQPERSGCGNGIGDRKAGIAGSTIGFVEGCAAAEHRQWSMKNVIQAPCEHDRQQAARYEGAVQDSWLGQNRADRKSDSSVTGS